MAIFILISKCNNHKENNKIVVKNDTIKSLIIDTIFSNKINTKSSFDTLYVENTNIIVDTQYIVSQFLTNKLVINREFTDTILDFKITDTMYQNSIVGSSYRYKLIQRTYNNTIFRNRNRLLIGLNFNIGIDKQSKIPVQPTIILSTKNNMSFSLSYSPYVNYLGFGLFYNVKK